RRLPQEGRPNAAPAIRIGVDRGSNGVYNLLGDRLLIKPGRDILSNAMPFDGPQLNGTEAGGAGAATFNIGDTLGTGDVNEQPSSRASLVVRGDAAGKGLIRGW